MPGPGRGRARPQMVPQVPQIQLPHAPGRPHAQVRDPECCPVTALTVLQHRTWVSSAAGSDRAGQRCRRSVPFSLRLVFYIAISLAMLSTVKPFQQFVVKDNSTARRVFEGTPVFEPSLMCPQPHCAGRTRGPLPMPVHATDKPCGADCYKLQPGAVAAPLGHPQMAAAPLERMDSMPKRRGKGRWRPAKRACLPNGATAGNGGCAQCVPRSAARP